MIDEWITVREAVEKFGVTRQNIYGHIKKGNIHVKNGESVVILRDVMMVNKRELRKVIHKWVED